MREIKFRAWDKDFLRMLHDAAPLNDCLYWSNGASFDSNLNRYEVMQFTGLLDKNGKEIYEGDVVRGPFANQGGGRNTRHKEFNISVYWDQAAAQFSMKPIGNIFHGDYRWFPFWGICEVIGNIHENPELLEAQP